MKLLKGVDQTFVDNIESMSTDELKATVVRLQAAYQTNQEFKDGDDYQQAKAEWDLIAGPVRDVSVAIKNKTKLVMKLLKDKGQVE